METGWGRGGGEIRDNGGLLHPAVLYKLLGQSPGGNMTLFGRLTDIKFQYCFHYVYICFGALL